jgi:hypothetical protein
VLWWARIHPPTVLVGAPVYIQCITQKLVLSVGGSCFRRAVCLMGYDFYDRFPEISSVGCSTSFAGIGWGSRKIEFGCWAVRITFLNPLVAEDLVVLAGDDVWVELLVRLHIFWEVDAGRAVETSDSSVLDDVIHPFAVEYLPRDVVAAFYIAQWAVAFT